MTKHPDHISASKFLDELRRFQKGSVTRRHFLGVTGLGLATAVLSTAVPGLRPRKAYAGLSGTLNFTTWPNYFSQENFDNFTKQTGVQINVNVFGSNEEMLAKLQAGSTGALSWNTVCKNRGLDRGTLRAPARVWSGADAASVPVAPAKYTKIAVPDRQRVRA